MPVGPVASYNTALDAANLARSLLNDKSASLFDDAYLLDYMNAAYRDLQVELANAGMETFTEDYFVMPIPAITGVDPGLDVEVSFTGISGNIPSPGETPSLPSDLIEPLELQERLTGSTNEYQPMVDMTAHGGLPSTVQDGLLHYWEWRSDSLCFVGASQAMDVKMRYRKGFGGFALVSSAGTVSTAGTVVTWGSGQQFDVSGAWTGKTITINGVAYVVAIVNSITSLILVTSAGTQTGVAYQAPSQVSGAIQVLGALNAVAYLTAAFAAKARGSPVANDYAQAAEDYMEKIILTVSRAQQHSMRRRRPFSSRGRARPFSW